MHPAVKYTKGLHILALLRELEERVTAGLIKKRTRGPLAIFHYTEDCVFDRKWDPFTLMARGLVIDTEAQRLVATPFPKFFNYGEHKEALPEEPFTVHEKLDGSLGIVFWHDDRWQITTKGTFDTEQAVMGQQMLDALDHEELMTECTYLFEIVGPWNQIVVPYAKSELVLLGAYMWNGVEIHPTVVDAIAAALGIRAAARHDGKTLDDLLELAKTLPRTEEGFVVRFDSGLRLKIKGDAYVRAHKLASRVTPIGVWEAMLAGDDLEALRKEIPEELWTDFDNIVGLLTDKLLEKDVLSDALMVKYADASLKEIGLANDPDAWMVFSRRRGKDLLTDPKCRRTLFDSFRPNSNRLEGYTPSTSLNRFKEI